MPGIMKTVIGKTHHCQGRTSTACQ